MSDPQVRRINFSKVVGSPYCVSIEDGGKAHDAVVEALEGGARVEISFEGITRLTTAFLNAAVGQLYDDYTEEQLKSLLLPPINATQEQLRLLVKVVENAKKFFADPDRQRAAFQAAQGDE